MTDSTSTSKTKWVIGGLVVALIAGLGIVVPVVTAMLAATTLGMIDRCQAASLDANGIGVGRAGVRVMSFNILTGTRTAASAGLTGSQKADFAWSRRGVVVAEYIRNVQPDLLGLQEVSRVRGTNTRQISLLKARVPGYTWLFADRAVPIAIRKGAFTPSDKGVIRLNSKGRDGATSDRWAVWVKLRATNGEQLLFVNLHAQYQQNRKQAKARSAGWSRLVAGLRKVNPGNLPSIMVGDFNALNAETRPVFKDHLTKLGRAGFVDAAATARTRIAPVSRVTSFNGFGERVGGRWFYKAINRSTAGNHIDYVWTAGRAAALSWQIYTGPSVTWRNIRGQQVPFAGFIPSDHWPVLAEVQVGAGSTPSPGAAAAAQKPSGAVPAVEGYRADQVRIAAAIVAAGTARGLDTWTITVGVMAGIGESSLRNLSHGDAARSDTIGVFQIGPEHGSYADRMNPTWAAGNFFHRLLKVAGYRGLAPTIAAHRAQRNADPHHYSQFWNDAVRIVAAISNDPSLLASIGTGTSADCDPGIGGGELPGFSGDCRPSRSPAEAGLRPTALYGLRCVAQAFPQIKSMGGRGGRPISASDHPRGLAVDFMVPLWRTSEGKALGWRIAKWAQANAKKLNVKYIIWDRKKWNPGVNDQWRAYVHPLGNYNPTVAHEDHVHISFNDAPYSN